MHQFGPETAACGQWRGSRTRTNTGAKHWSQILSQNGLSQNGLSDKTMVKNRVQATLGPVLLCGAIARTPLGTSHVGVESGHQSSTARSAKAHLGSKGHSLLSLQTPRASDGIRTGQKNMVGTFWLLLQLLHSLK